MRVLFLFSILMLGACAKHIFQPAFVGVVCDAQTRLPIKNAEIRFIQDTLTLGNTFGSENININDLYFTNEEGTFQTKIYKDRYMRGHQFLSDLSWIFVVKHDLYEMDTISLHNIEINRPQHILDTIWLTKSSFTSPNND